MSSIFISYSRKDISFAEKIVQALARNKLDTWIDWKSIPKGEDWEQEIYRGIEEAETFLFLISPDSVQSEMCNKEIAHAVRNNKRVIPIVIRDAVVKNFLYEISRNEISRLNWIFCREMQDDFRKATKEILNTIHTDYDWLKYHTGLQVKALEWERNNQEKGFLLYGKELQDAELQLAANSSKEPYPTDLQREYVLISRQTTDRQRRITTSIATVGAIALAILALFAFVQAGRATNQANVAQTAEANALSEANGRATAQAQAEERAIIARSGELAAQAVSLRDKDFLQSLLLGVEAYNMLDTPRTRGTVLDNIQINPQLRRYLHSGQRVYSVAFSPDGKILASVSYNTIILWDVPSGLPTGQQLKGDKVFNDIAFSPDGKTLASASADGTITLWNVATGLPIGRPLSVHTDLVGYTEISFSPDGKTLASTNDNTIILWDVASGLPTGQQFKGDEGPVLLSLAFSPDGKTLASGSGNIKDTPSRISDNAIILWDVASSCPRNG